MTTDDLKAARERWVNYANHGYSRAYKFPEEEFRDDSHTLARAYCKLFDDTPIDEEWARQINCQYESPDSKPCVISIERLGDRPNSLWMVELIDGHTGDFYGSLVAKTRGQFRLLLLAMESQK